MCTRRRKKGVLAHLGVMSAIGQRFFSVSSSDTNRGMRGAGGSHMDLAAVSMTMHNITKSGKTRPTQATTSYRPAVPRKPVLQCDTIIQKIHRQSGVSWRTGQYSQNNTGLGDRTNMIRVLSRAIMLPTDMCVCVCLCVCVCVCVSVMCVDSKCQERG